MLKFKSVLWVIVIAFAIFGSTIIFQDGYYILGIFAVLGTISLSIAGLLEIMENIEGD